MFKTMSERQVIRRIKIDETLLNVKGIRTIILYTWTESDFIKIIFRVLYVSYLKFNLFLVRHAINKGY